MPKVDGCLYFLTWEEADIVNQIVNKNIKN